MKITVDVTEKELMEMETTQVDLHGLLVHAIDEYGDFCGFDVEIIITD